MITAREHSHVALGAETLTIRRWPWPLWAGRTIHYDEITSTRLTDGNGHGGPTLTLTLTQGREVILLPGSRTAAHDLAAALGEIVEPAVLREERPLPLDRLPEICRDLLASAGANYRKTAELLIRQANRHQATDLNIEPGTEGWNVSFKVDGVLFSAVRLDHAAGERIVRCLKVAAGLVPYRTDLIQEGRLSSLAGRPLPDIRLSILPTAQGERVALRLSDSLKSRWILSDLGFAPEVLAGLEAASAWPQGLFLVGGPSGSGKTTTLYALLRHLRDARGRLCNLIAIEDPIEAQLPGVTQIQVSARNSGGLAELLRSSLRQDPGVIMVGEIRDEETAQAAVQAALTGHLVLSSIHSGSAAEAITRLLDLGVRPFLLESTLAAVLGQRLVRLACSCRATGPSRGCPDCRATGYRGRTAVGELLSCRGQVRALISTAPSTQALEAAARTQGLVTLAEHGTRLLAAGLTDLDELKRVLG